MKKVLILRHAKAEFNNKLDDHARALTLNGIKQCGKVADNLLARKTLPDLILCSSAVRTTDTVKHVLEYLNMNIPTKSIDSLYQGSADDILHEIAATDDKINTLMIVAHNPGVQNFCSEFALNGNAPDILSIKSSFTPGSAALFSFPVADAWTQISPHASELEWFVSP